MTPRSWGISIFVAAAIVAMGSLSIGLDPCVSGSIVILAGLAVLIILVSVNAKARLDESRADLMRAAQMCPRCGYTIRAKTDRCPECGTPCVADASRASDA